LTRDIDSFKQRATTIPNPTQAENFKMKVRDLTYLRDGVYQLETGDCEGHPREGGLCVILFGCIETDFNVRKLEEDAEFQYDTPGSP